MGSLGFGIDLGLRQRGVSFETPPVSSISELEVLGLAPLPDGADAAVPNGWVARVTLPDDGASTFDPAKISLAVSDPGFDTSGAATTVLRTVTGTAIVRRQYPGQTVKLDSVSSGVRTVYFALSADIYQGSTVTSATAAEGYCGAAPAGTIGSVVNASSLAYPKPQFAWMNTQHERAVGAVHDVEAVAFHAHAINGQQVACVRFYAVDGSGGTSPDVVAAMPELSAIQTQGNIAEVWKASLALANLGQGELCRVNARVHPWIGDESAVLDLFEDGIAVTGSCTTMNPQTPLRFVCDKSGGYGGLHAAARVGAGTGAVQASYAAAIATPYPTIQAAIAALVAANGSSKGHANHSGGTVWLMETTSGAGATHAIGASSASAAGLCWTDIRLDPAATGSVKAQLSATAAQTSMLRWQVPIEVTGGFNLNGGSGAGGNTMIALENMTLSYTGAGTAPINTGFGLGFAKNLTLAGGTNVYSPFFGLGTNRIQMRGIGVIATDIAAPTGGAGVRNIYPWTLIGCRFANWVFRDDPWAAAANLDTTDGAVIYNNSFMKMQAACQVAQTGSPGYARGVAIVQNVFERNNTAATACLGIGNDGTAVAFDNINEFHNSFPGAGAAGANIGRTNRAYADVAGAAGVSKRMISRFNIYYDFNCKTDSFTANTTVSGRTGNWRYRYQVGCAGNVVVLGGDDGTIAPAATGWLGDYWPPSSAPGAAAVGFTANQAGTGGAGNGAYTLAGPVNDAYGRVASGAAALRYDLAGAARRNDGSGAAGAYERSD